MGCEGCCGCFGLSKEEKERRRKAEEELMKELEETMKSKGDAKKGE